VKVTAVSVATLELTDDEPGALNEAVAAQRVARPWHERTAAGSPARQDD